MTTELADHRFERQLTRTPGLDGLRGIAITLVILVHLRRITFDGPTHIRVFDTFFEGGFVGVDLFMVLSGFLITNVITREWQVAGQVKLRAFYGRRAVRLLPALAVLLVAHMIYAVISRNSPVAGGNPGVSTAAILSNELRLDLFTGLYVANWYAIKDVLRYPTDMGHLWSLAVEEQFYLIWPGVLWLWLRSRRHVWTLAGFLALAVAAVAVWRIILWNRGIGWVELSIRSDTRVDPLLIGAFVGLLWSSGRTPRRWLNEAGWAAVAVMIAILFLVAADTAASHQWGGLVFALASAVLLLAVVEGQWSGISSLETGLLQWLGKVSYALYLWHAPIFSAVGQYRPWRDSVVMVEIAVALSLIAAALSWRFVEQPLLDWNSRRSVRRAVEAAAKSPTVRAQPL